MLGKNLGNASQINGNTTGTNDSSPRQTAKDSITRSGDSSFMKMTCGDTASWFRMPFVASVLPSIRTALGLLELCLLIHRKLVIEVKIKFQNVYPRFSQETELSSLSVLCHKRPNLIDSRSPCLGDPRQLKFG